MLRSGNGTAQQCALNLLKLEQGEVYYSRLKGLSVEAVDKPAPEAAEILQEQAEWLIETYEPRFELSEVNIEALLDETTTVSNVTVNGTVTE